MVDNDILNAFPIENSMPYISDKIKVGIFTNDADKAENVLYKIFWDNIDVAQRFVNDKDTKSVLLEDGTWYVWIKPILKSRGHRCRKAYIDRNINVDVLYELVVPICLFCTRKDITIF